MPMNTPVIMVRDGMDLEELGLCVENITVIKPVKREGETQKNGYTLKILFTYNFGGKRYKTDRLRIRFDGGKMKRIGAGQNPNDMTSFIPIEESSPNFAFLKHLHEKISDHLVENVMKTQPNLYIQTMINFDDDFSEVHSKTKSKSVTEIVAMAKAAFDEFDDAKKQSFNKSLAKSVRDTFRFQRKKPQDWCLLKPSTMSEDCHNMGLSVYTKKDSGIPNDYDIRVYEVNIEDGGVKRNFHQSEVEDAVGSSNKKGMIDYEHLIIEMKNPHMNASEEAISFGFIVRFIGITSGGEEEYDPITNTYVSKKRTADAVTPSPVKADTAEPDIAPPPAKAAKTDCLSEDDADPPPLSNRNTPDAFD